MGENMQELSLIKPFFKETFWYLIIVLLCELVLKWQVKEINFDCSGCAEQKNN